MNPGEIRQKSKQQSPNSRLTAELFRRANRRGECLSTEEQSPYKARMSLFCCRTEAKKVQTRHRCPEVPPQCPFNHQTAAFRQLSPLTAITAMTQAPYQEMNSAFGNSQATAAASPDSELEDFGVPL